jgi:aryl-alcohol dehydrogenase-like predicted oxidoreductase
MKIRRMGQTGLKVSEICLGTMTFGHQCDERTSFAILEKAAGAGVNFLDTADAYPVPPTPQTAGRTEEILGNWLKGRRDRFVLATKYSLSVDKTDPNAGGNHRKSLVRSLEQSLRRLRTDYVDVLWLHMRDATTPIEEAVRALDDQVRLGKVLYVGISDSPAWVVAQANTLAELGGWSPFVALQLPYSVAARDPERELLPMAAAFGLTITAWGVLGAGVLTGKPAAQRRWPDDPVSEREAAAAAEVAAVAGELGAAPAQVAIAWLLARPAPPATVPILGARTEEQIRTNVGALDVSLDADQLERLDRVGAPALGFPRAFLESRGVLELIYGETRELLSV